MTLNLENVSDNELRARLEQAGHAVGPITNTTRGVYLSLLKKIVKNGALLSLLRLDNISIYKLHCLYKI